jgi:PiT family inorganic phosphate transporter
VTAVIFGVVVLLTAAFAFLNGFRDASTAVALAVRTRALTPSVAVLLAAFFNFVGALVSAGLAVAVSQAWISLPPGTDGLSILVAGLASACAWGLLLWWRGIPASSTHALVGGLAGAGLASLAMGGDGVGGVDQSLLFQVVLPLVLSPLVAYSGAFMLVYPATWAARYTQPNVVNQRFRRSQAIAAGAVAFGHGLQDGQRVSAVLLLALLAAGYSDGGTIPWWVVLLSAGMMTAGTMFGGWRISHTVGYKITRIDPLRGSVAQIFSAVILFVGAIGLHWPLSTTHTVTAAVLGAGENQHFSVTNR